MATQIGVITEQNDLGLGFDPLSQKDQKAYQESQNQNVQSQSTASQGDNKDKPDK